MPDRPGGKRLTEESRYPGLGAWSYGYSAARGVGQRALEEPDYGICLVRRSRDGETRSSSRERNGRDHLPATGSELLKRVCAALIQPLKKTGAGKSKRLLFEPKYQRGVLEMGM